MEESAVARKARSRKAKSSCDLRSKRVCRLDRNTAHSRTFRRRFSSPRFLTRRVFGHELVGIQLTAPRIDRY